jgi:hypothetical protein
MTTIISGDGTITGLTATGISAVQQLPAGSVLQVVQGTTTTSASNSTTTYADTNLTATITPKFATSKVLVIVHQNGIDKYDGNSGNAMDLKIQKNGSDLITFLNFVGYTNTNLRVIIGSSSIVYLDSPASTSALTYKTQFRNRASASQVMVQSNDGYSTITLMEIAA